ncbi:MAG: glutamate-1-semialdehyde 2,1-aminomutase [Myxococcota bacterium]
MDRHEELFARARGVLPGGVSSPVRAFKSVGGHPRYIQRGEGATLIGVEGERWTDYCLAWGPMILGHAHPRVVEAVTKAARDGLAFGTTHPGEVELGEKILRAFPGRDRARLVCTGTEAVLTALRIARGATGRTKILKFGGCYHGHADSMLVKAGSGLVTLGVGDSAGVSPAVAADTVVVPLDDEQAIDDAFATFGDDIAAAIVEPLPANNGLLIQRREWLQHLRQACTKHGALLILDEVISGFRFGYHGYERLVDVPADLTTLGKIVGGGMPVAAIVGKKEHMDLLAPEGPVYQAGTMAGNPVAVAAGIATLDVLAEGEVYAHLDALGRHFDAIPKERTRWLRQGPILWPWLGGGEGPRSDANIPSSVRAPFARMHAAWLDAGIYFPPSAFEVGFLCSAHTTADLDRLVDVAERALAE